MSRTVWKYRLDVTDVQTVTMPFGARVLTVQAQDGDPMLWALVDPDMPHVKTRQFLIMGTGHPTAAWRYCWRWWVSTATTGAPRCGSMPRKDPVERRAWENEWIRRRRAELLARHACPCGAPATRIVSDPGTGKVTWSWAEARIEALLANKRLRCGSCPDGERPGQSDEARAERHREANRDYKARRRAAKRAASADPPGSPPDPPRAVQERPERAATVTGRVKAAAAPSDRIASDGSR